MSSPAAGDQAFIDACLAHFTPLCRYARTCVRSVEEAEDLTQEVMLHALQARRSFNGGNLKAWLYQIARNRIAKHHRRKGVERRGQEIVRERYAPRTPTDDFAALELQDALLSALESLNPLEQEVVRLKFADFANDEIARLLNITPNYLHVLFYRAIQKLRVSVAKNDPDPRKVSVPR